MKLRTSFITTGLICCISLFAIAQTEVSSPKTQEPHILLCGGSEVIEGHVMGDGPQAQFKQDWVWRPENSAGLPGYGVKTQFLTTDDCKPVEGGRNILITSSGNAVALVDHSTGNTLFYATVRNAHSATLVPGSMIAVASSDAAGGDGDRIVLFDRGSSNQVLASFPFKSAHGVEWDTKRSVLWILGHNELAELHVEHPPDRAASMTLVKAFTLPVGGAHDLVLAQDSSTLYITTGKRVFTFSINDAVFAPYVPLDSLTGVKSLSIEPATGQVMYTQADEGVWWTYSLRFHGPDAIVTLPWMTYKARWYASK
jgi:hypothetical protein